MTSYLGYIYTPLHSLSTRLLENFKKTTLAFSEKVQ